MRHSLVIFAFFSCTLSSMNMQSDSTCLRITKKIPILTNSGRVDRYETQYAFVHSQGDLRLYETPYYYDSIIDEHNIKTMTLYKIFVHHKDSIYGRGFDLQNNILNLRVHRDSFSSIIYFTDLRLKDLFEDEILTMKSSEKNNSLGIYCETYSITGKKNAKKSGLALFCYSEQLKNIDITLSKELDSIHKMKLCEVIIQTDPQLVKEANMWIDTIKVTHKIEPVKTTSISNPSYYFSFFKQQNN